MAKPIILTIDDEMAVLTAIERDLRGEYGDAFRVMKAASGQEALAELARRGSAVALFLAAQRMPGMTGTQFLERAAAIYPTPKRSC